MLITEQSTRVKPLQVNNHAELVDSLISLIKRNIDHTGNIDLDEKFRRQLADVVEQSRQQEKLAETKNISILLSDLRGFTSIAEKYSPLTVIELLNRYFQKMSQVIDSHQGVIDKFMGDSIMVLFGANDNKSSDIGSDIKSDIKKPLACAIEMQIAMNEINEISDALGMANLYMGIGINTGEVVAGTLGSDIYREYTVIGDQVNLVSRVEAHSLRGQILLSENTYRLAKDIVEIGEVNEVQVKGKSHPVKMYELLAITQPSHLKVPRREIRRSPRVEVNIPLSYQKIDGKQVLSTQFTGRIIDMSYGGLFTQTTEPLAPFSEIKVIVSLSLMGGGNSEIYARVLTCKKTPDCFESHLEFTAIEDPARKAIKSYVDQLIPGQNG
ncbi:adenylate/guanylate cyclase domain-containing protein [Aliikangiella coralliicola]|uniref:Adenylate cyclase n=1 Tax=Aliikangiella coralliicola TaxID=2592383 RepID=A0A545U0B2_9GAMM|nr:adenylate/guanylate cyclase domain-containing protein [Aliikangiella coralliicola]TQV82906.1 adenylate cyclase [Aliikangiella coralliicola]